MRSKLSYIVAALTSILLISMIAFAPASAFIYPSGAVDTKYEYYGPHADILQMKMYLGEDAMFTALSLGQIDLTDWPLTTSWRTGVPPTGFAGDPNVVMVSAGGEAGYYTVDFNYNPHPRMGNPPGSPPNRPNPVYTAIPGYSKSIDGVAGIPPISNNQFFRLGVGCLFNRTEFTNYVGAAGIPIITPVPSYMGGPGGWVWAGATTYPFNKALAEANFTLGHVLQDKTVMPWKRYYDYNENGVRDTGEDTAAVLKMTWRQDAYRRKAGEMIYAQLLSMNFTFTNSGDRTGGDNYQQVMLDKNYHMTTLGWIFIGPDPDFLYDLYHITGYWDDPESSAPNTAALNDTILNGFAEGIKFAPNSAVALTNAISFQQRFWAQAFQIPLFSNNAFKAHRKWYSGGNAETLTAPDDGENIYRRTGTGAKREWLGITNQQGFGDNSWWSLLNMWPNCTIYPTGAGLNHMTIRYGWKEQQYPQHINPFYSEWYWDSIVLGAAYDGLGYRNPYSLAQWKPDLVKTWTAGIWDDGGTTKSKVTVTLKPDIYFQDGVPLTIEDVVFSLVEAGQLLITRGFQPPWWWPTGELVRSMSIIDPYTVEILYDVYSFLVESWTLGGFYIVPKHIWYPIINSGNPSQFAPDPNVIGSGPWRYKSLTATSSLVMLANRVGSQVQTDQPGSSLITSPYGTHYNDPVYVNVHLKTPTEYNTKVNLEHTVGTAPVPWIILGIKVTMTSQYLDPTDGIAVPLLVNKYVYIDGVLQPGYPVLDTLDPGIPLEEQLTYNFSKCAHTITVKVHIKGPAEIEPGKPNPWISHWINVTQPIWVTVLEDTGGLGNPSRPLPDCTVDMKDISTAAKAFGSNPGHPRWQSASDINRDYTVDMKDISTIAKMFGKW